MGKILKVSDDGLYRVRLEVWEDAPNPRRNMEWYYDSVEAFDRLAHVITPRGQRYVAPDEDGGPLQYGWDHFEGNDDEGELFSRWARIFHGAVVVEDDPFDGPRTFWYVLPSEIGGLDPERVIRVEIEEYRAWAKGEVYEYILERRVIWIPKDEEESEILGEMTTWEEEESCCGLIGYKWARTSALEAFSTATTRRSRNEG